MFWPFSFWLSTLNSTLNTQAKLVLRPVSWLRRGSYHDLYFGRGLRSQFITSHFTATMLLSVPHSAAQLDTVPFIVPPPPAVTRACWPWELTWAPGADRAWLPGPGTANDSSELGTLVRGRIRAGSSPLSEVLAGTGLIPRPIPTLAGMGLASRLRRSSD